MNGLRSANHLDRAEQQLAPATSQFLQKVRAICPPLTTDQPIGDEIEALANYLLTSDELVAMSK